MKLMKLLLSTLLVGTMLGCAKDRAGIQSSYTHSGVAPIGDLDRIAVLDFEGAGGAAFADLFAQEMMRAKLNVVERSRISAVIDERDVRATTNDDISLNALRGQIGGVVGARVLLVGAVVEQVDALQPSAGGTLGRNSILVTCRAIDPKTGRVLWTGAVKTGASIANGQFAGPLTAWRLAAQDLIKGYREASYSGTNVAYEAESIPR